MDKTTSARTALLVGATGLVGGALLTRLLDAPDCYSSVRTLSRRAVEVQHDRLNSEVLDFSQLEQAPNGWFMADDVFLCLGTTIKQAGSQAAFRRVDYDYPLQIARLAQQQGAQRFFLVSSIGASAKSAVFYSRTKGQLEEALQALALYQLHIFRPSVLTGERRERRPSEIAAAKTGQWLSPVLVGALAKFKPIAAQVVARAMLQAACPPTGATGTYIYESDAIWRLGT